MSNYLHLIVRTGPDIVATWSDEEAVRRVPTVHRIIHSKDGQIKLPSDADIQVREAPMQISTRVRAQSAFSRAPSTPRSGLFWK